MTDYTGTTSLSASHITADNTSDQSPRSIPTSPGECCLFSKPPSNMIIALDNHPYQSPSSSENTPRKPRGRPAGSKNKPKPPVVITRENDSAMKPVILQIAAGSDIIDAITSHARRNNVGISIMSVTGSVSNVTLRHPFSQAPAISVNGPFGLLSLSGSFVEPTTSCCFGVTLAGAQGQVFGGMVGGKVTAATQVIVVAATFVNPEFHRLPCEGNVGGGGGGSIGSCSSAGMSMVNYHN